MGVSYVCTNRLLDTVDLVCFYNSSKFSYAHKRLDPMPPTSDDPACIRAFGKNLSVLALTGVRLENTEGDKIWMCLASATCRQQHRSYSINSGTSTATQHLSQTHNIISKKQLSTLRNKRDRQARIEDIISSDLYTANFCRYCKWSMINEYKLY